MTNADLHKNTVFILGAGFSKDLAGIPTLVDLSKSINQSIDNDAGLEAQFLKKEVPSYIRMNIEHLMTYLYQALPWRNEGDASLAKAAYFYVTKKVVSELERLEALAREALLHNSSAKQLVSYWHKWESTVVTFNYDTLIELFGLSFLCAKEYRAFAASYEVGNFPLCESLEFIVNEEFADARPEIIEPIVEWADVEKKHLRVWLPKRDLVTAESTRSKLIPFCGADVPLYLNGNLPYDLKRVNEGMSLDQMYQIPINNILGRTASVFSGGLSKTFKLLKLHGSMNWLYSGNTDYGGEQLFYFPIKDFQNDSSQSLANRNKKDLVPLIIPPVLDKALFYFNNGIRLQWTLAKEAMKRAQRVVIIGYSFPPTDISTRFLISESLKDVNAEIVLLVKGDNKQSVVNEAQQLFGKDIKVPDIDPGEPSIQKALEVLS